MEFVEPQASFVSIAFFTDVTKVVEPHFCFLLSDALFSEMHLPVRDECRLEAEGCTTFGALVRSFSRVHTLVFLQNALLWKLSSASFALEPSTMLLHHVLLEFFLLLELILTLIALIKVNFFVFMPGHVEEHRLCSGVSLTTLRARTIIDPMLLL